MSRQEAEASRSKERDYWDRVFARPDPWNYAGAYERRKYRHTLELMPDEPVGCALEIGCAEGMFTELLADRVGSLLAVDISEVALERARARCAGKGHVGFAQADIGEGVIGGGYDLIVCAEVLYYLPDYAAVERFARQVREELDRGGQLPGEEILRLRGLGRIRLAGRVRVDREASRGERGWRQLQTLFESGESFEGEEEELEGWLDESQRTLPMIWFSNLRNPSEIGRLSP